jgi:hypothetical protein
MSNKGDRERLMAQVVSTTEEKVAELLARTRRRRTKRARRGQTPLQEFKGNLASMTNEEVTEMVKGTRPKNPGYLASLMHLPIFVLQVIARMLGWHRTEHRSS